MTSMDEKIKNLLERGVEKIYPSKEFLESLLKSGKKLTIYFGIDPTGPSLHLGHAIVLRKLKEFQDLGHKIILLIGDFTAMIGDPTGKSESRKQLARKEVLNNAKLYKKQASTFLNFSGANKAEVKYNSKWLTKMNFEEVLNLSSKMTVGQMIERDMFQERIKNGKPIYLHEFLYPLMQGYDSVVLNVDGEIGGNDQTFNMLAGRSLSKEMIGKEKFVLALKLLVDSQGIKMGKTDGNMVTLADSAENMFGKIMSWDDGLIIIGFSLCTCVSELEISQIKQALEMGENPMNFKKRLALEITKIYYGEKKAVLAENDFTNTFSHGGIPENLEEIKVRRGEELKKIILDNKILSSGTEFSRFVRDGAVSVNEEKISNLFFKIEKNSTVKIGKKKFIRITIL